MTALERLVVAWCDREVITALGRPVPAAVLVDIETALAELVVAHPALRARVMTTCGGS